MAQFIVALAVKLPHRKNLTMAAFDDETVEAESEFEACCDFLQNHAKLLNAATRPLRGVVVARQQNDRRYWTARVFRTMPAPDEPDIRSKLRILRGDVAYSLETDGQRLLFSRVLALPPKCLVAVDL